MYSDPNHWASLLTVSLLLLFVFVFFLFISVFFGGEGGGRELGLLETFEVFHNP